MKYAYGFKRDEKDFAHIEYDELFIDHDNDRMERGAMVNDHLRGNAGDEIYILKSGELGLGVFMSHIEEMNAKIIVEPPEYDPRKRGPKSRFNPKGDNLKRIKKLWNGPDSPSLILPKINGICGFEVPRHVLNYHLGPRDKRKRKPKQT